MIQIVDNILKNVALFLASIPNLIWQTITIGILTLSLIIVIMGIVFIYKLRNTKVEHLLDIVEIKMQEKLNTAKKIHRIFRRILRR